MSSIEVIKKSEKVEDIIYFVKENDTLISICNKFCVLKEDLIRDNDLEDNYEAYEGDILWIRKKNLAIHIVKPLETIESIAKLYNVSVKEIQEKNGITKVFLGQKIII